MQLNVESLAQLRLARTPGVGPVGYRRALFHYKSNGAAVEAFSAWAKKGQQLADEDGIQRELEALEKAGGTLLLWGDDAYPAPLAELPDPPLVLSVLGNADALHQRQVALVGNRNASAAGLKWSNQLAAALATQHVVVTSGLARGIDTAAHEGTLSAGGETVAVVAGGVNHIYPPENATLRERIIGQGAVISEQAWGMAPTAQLFPRRNRIIAGLSVGVAVSEASRYSGSLITAQCALDYNREVWAVPGNPADPRAGGPNWLLKNGAVLVETAADILDGLPASPAPYIKAPDQPSLLGIEVDDARIAEEELAPAETNPRGRVYELLGPQPMATDELLHASGLDETALTILLVELELEGHAVRETDGRWRRG